MMVTLSDDVVVPWLTADAALEITALAQTKQGCGPMCGYAALDSDCMTRNTKTPSFSHCSKIKPSVAATLSQQGDLSAGPTDSAMRKPTLHEARSLV